MVLSTDGLVLRPDSPIDFQLHTTYSDGRWAPDALVEHLAAEGFGLAAITDHERVDTYEANQALAAEKHMPILPAAEFTTTWHGWTDVLCFGFRPGETPLTEVARDVFRRQSDDTRGVYATLRGKGIPTSDDPAELDELLTRPSAWQPFALAELAVKLGYKPKAEGLWPIAKELGCRSADTDIALVVDAAHRSGAVCLIAHPGRGGDNPIFDGPASIDELRAYAPVDGLEAYYRLHTPEQTQMYVDYARKHKLLVSSGSDSHSLEKPPIKWPAENCRALLEHVGVRIEG